MSGLSGYRYGAGYRYRVAQALDAGGAYRIPVDRCRAPLHSLQNLWRQILRNFGRETAFHLKLFLLSRRRVDLDEQDAVDPTELDGLVHDQHGRSWLNQFEQ